MEAEYITKHHKHQEIGPNQCSSCLTKRIKASTDIVCAFVRRFDQPQRYQPFISECNLRGDFKVGTVREVNVRSGLPATTSTERLELLDDVQHILGVRITGGDHRLKDYHAENSKYFYYQYYLCNPVSKQWVELPLISTRDVVGFTCYYSQQARGQDGVSRIWADTDSYEDIIRNNADYDPNKIDFTVVSINWDNEKDEFNASVFSSTDEAAEWSIFHVPCPPGSRWTGMDLRAKLVFLNGKFHCCGTNCIAAYDPFNKPLHCDIIPLPPMDPVKSGTHTELVLEACQGCLRLVKDFFTGRFVVWDLVDYANKVWVQIFDVDTDLRFQSFVGVAARDKVYMLADYSSAIKLFDVRNKSEQHVYDHITSDNNVYKLRSVTPFFSSPWPTPVAVGQKKLMSYINFP